MQQEILDIYQQSFSRPEVIYKKLNKKYTLQQIKNVLKNIDTNQIIGKKQENKDLSIPISSPIGSFQADLTFYDQFSRQNQGFSVLLTIIEINTRFAYVYKLKDKKAESILKCLQDLLEKEKTNLKSISFDAGSEFDNKLVKDFLDKNKISYIFFNKNTHPNATMIIERFNRTLRDKISKYQDFHKQKNYVDDLQSLVNQYNNTEHSSIKMTPQQAKEQHFSNNQTRQEKLEINQKIDQTFKIDDFVRILRNKKLFEKGQKNYTKNVYKIIGKEDNNFIVKKYKDGKLQDKEMKKTAQYLMKVNVFELIQNIKKKKEISKKEVKQQTNLEKRFKREGINLRNIIENEKYLDDYLPNQINKKPEIDKLQIVEQLRDQKKIKDQKDQLDKKDTENRLIRIKSNEDLSKYKELVEKKEEENIQIGEELNQTKIQKKIKENEAEIKNYELLFNNNKIDVTNSTVIQNKQNLFKLMKKYDVEKILQFYNENKQSVLLKNIVLNQQQLNGIKKFLKLKKVDDQDFKKPKKQPVSDYTLYLQNFQQMSQIYFNQQKIDLQQENEELKKQYQEQSEDESEKEEEKEKTDDEGFIDRQLKQKYISDSEYFQQNELDNYNTEDEIKYKIQDLQQDIDFMYGNDEIEMLERINQYESMIKMLQQKLKQIKQQPEKVITKLDKFGKK